MSLIIKNLHVTVSEKKIIDNLSLEIKKRELHVLMGPNGSGKSTFSLTIMGYPDYKISKGQIILNKKDLTNLSPEIRSQNGLFLSFQKPVTIPGVCYLHFLRQVFLNHTKKTNNNLSIREFLEILRLKAKELSIAEELVKKGVNDQMSGGEQKKMELLTMAILKPSFAILDEIDTGLDVDALKLIAKFLSIIKKETGILLITHNPRILKFLKPDCVHIMIRGEIVKSGKIDLINEIESKGFMAFNSKIKI